MEKLMNAENEWSIDDSKVEGAVRRIEVEEVVCYESNENWESKWVTLSGVAIELF